MRHHGVIVNAADAPTDDAAGAADATFALFYERQLAPAVRLAHLIVGSTTVAQDVVHDVFISVHTRWSSIDNPEAYLRTALINRCRSSQRRQIVERLHLRRPTSVTAAIPEVDETWASVQRLPADQRTVLVLRFYAGPVAGRNRDRVGPARRHRQVHVASRTRPFEGAAQ